jgi:hypothetical protein
MANSASRRFSHEEMLGRAFYRIAWNIRSMWEEKGSSDTRLLIEPMIPDDFVLVGQSKAAVDKANQYKEHVVPRMMICEECHRMFEHGACVEDVGRFIRKYLKIVLLTKEEQDRLDKWANLKLRQSMPTGWTFRDGSVFARLEFARIEFDLYPERL